MKNLQAKLNKTLKDLDTHMAQDWVLMSHEDQTSYALIQADLMNKVSDLQSAIERTILVREEFKRINAKVGL